MAECISCGAETENRLEFTKLEIVAPVCEKCSHTGRNRLITLMIEKELQLNFRLIKESKRQFDSKLAKLNERMERCLELIEELKIRLC